MKKVRGYMVLIGIASVVLALDQWTKYLVRLNLEVGEAWSPAAWLMPFVRILHTNNTGAAFGFFPSGSMIFTVVAVVVSLAILYYYPQVETHQIALRLALSLQLGGAMGNLVDRLMIGTVTDFISVGTFAVFNVADSSISIGVAILIISMYFQERREALARKAPQPAESGNEDSASGREHSME